MKFVMGQGKPDGSDKTQFEEQCPSSIDDTFESISASVAVSGQAPGANECTEDSCMTEADVIDLLHAAQNLQ
jgi:hypothetical protein